MISETPELDDVGVDLGHLIEQLRETAAAARPSAVGVCVMAIAMFLAAACLPVHGYAQVAALILVNTSALVGAAAAAIAVYLPAQFYRPDAVDRAAARAALSAHRAAVLAFTEDITWPARESPSVRARAGTPPLSDAAGILA